MALYGSACLKSATQGNTRLHVLERGMVLVKVEQCLVLGYPWRIAGLFNIRSIVRNTMVLRTLYMRL